MRRLLRKAEVRSIVGLSNSTIDRLEAKGEFPLRIPLTPKTSAWNSEAIEAWVDRRLETNDESLVAQRMAAGKRLTQARAGARQAASAP